MRKVVVESVALFIALATATPAVAWIALSGTWTEANFLLIQQTFVDPIRVNIRFTNLETTGFTIGEGCSIGLKNVNAIATVDSVTAKVDSSGSFITPFNFVNSSVCDSDFTTLLGGTSTGFNSTASNSGTNGWHVIVIFHVTLKVGKTIGNLSTALTQGTLSPPGPNGTALAKSPVLGGGKSSGNARGTSRVPSYAPAGTCLNGNSDVSFTAQPAPSVPTLSTMCLLVVLAGLMAMALIRLPRHRR